MYHDKYNEIFRKAKADNYVAYTGHMDKDTASQIKKESKTRGFFKICLETYESNKAGENRFTVI